MNRKEKIKLIEDIQSGKIKIKDLRPKTVVIFYDPQSGKYYLERGVNVMTEGEAKIFAKDFETVFYIPDNFRD